MTVCSRPFERIRTIAWVSIGRDGRTDTISVSFRNYQFAGPSDPVIELPVACFARKPIARRLPKRPAIWPHCAYPDLHGYQDQAQDLRALRPHVRSERPLARSSQSWLVFGRVELLLARMLRPIPPRHEPLLFVSYEGQGAPRSRQGGAVTRPLASESSAPLFARPRAILP
jgi:hypothetical protein